MHLTFGTGIFWLLVVSGVGETIIRLAQIRSAKAPNNPELPDEVPALQRRVAELERRLDEQADVVDSQDQTIRRLEESGEFLQRLLRERETRSLPRADNESIDR
jgi:hypothetical protein